MKDQCPELSLAGLCRLLGFSPQAYYQHSRDDQKKKIKNELIVQQVHLIRKQHPAIGGRKLHYMLQSFLDEHQIKMGRDAFFSLLSDHYLLIRKRKRKVYTTQSNHWLRKYPNLIMDLEITKINQVWVSDLTYLKTHEGFVYISLITDAYSHLIVGYDVSANLEAVNATKALKMAISNTVESGAKLSQLIHHSDRGIQYCSTLYTEILNKHQIQISMSEKGEPLQNPIAERLNGILKYEYLLYHQINNLQEANKLLQASVDAYNNERPHLSCGMLTPERAHHKDIELIKRWKNYYKPQKTINQF